MKAWVTLLILFTALNSYSQSEIPVSEDWCKETLKWPLAQAHSPIKTNSIEKKINSQLPTMNLDKQLNTKGTLKVMINCEGRFFRLSYSTTKNE